MKRFSIWLAVGAAAIALAACDGAKDEPPPPAELGPDTASAAPTIQPNPAQGDGGVTDFYNPGGPRSGQARNHDPH
jgi:hypothetical protein